MAQTKDLTAYKAGEKAHDDKHKAKRKKTYRLKGPVVHLKQTYAKQQHKHPVLTGAAEAAALAGVMAGIGESQGLGTFRTFSKLRNIPILGRLYTEIADDTLLLARRFR